MVVTDGFLITNNNLCVVLLFVMLLFPLGFAACCLHLHHLCPSTLFFCWQDAVLFNNKETTDHYHSLLNDYCVGVDNTRNDFQLS